MNANIDDFDIEQARGLLMVWIRQRDAARQKRTHYERTEVGLTQMIDGVNAIFPDLATIAVADDTASPDPTTSEPSHVVEQAESVAQGRPPGMTSVDVVTTVVNDDDGVAWLRVEQVAQEVSRRGWTPEAENPEAAIRTALARAATKGRIESTQLDGRTKGYRRHILPNAEDPAATGSSVTDRSTEGRSFEEGGSPNGTGSLRGHDQGASWTPLDRGHDLRASVVEAHES